MSIRQKNRRYQSRTVKSSTHCKCGCGRTCNPGLTPNGNPFDTCCRSCAISNGSTSTHDIYCNTRNGSLSMKKSRHYRNRNIGARKWTLRRSKPCHGNKTMILYHVTNTKAADAIRTTQQMRRGTTGMFGGGIYFAETISVAKAKAHHTGYVVKALVLVGNQYKVNGSGAGTFGFRKLYKMGYDSIWAPNGSGTGSCERVVYNWDQVDIISVKKL